MGVLSLLGMYVGYPLTRPAFVKVVVCRVLRGRGGAYITYVRNYSTVRPMQIAVSKLGTNRYIHMTVGLIASSEGGSPNSVYENLP